MKVRSSFIDSIWSANLVHIYVINKLIKGICFLLIIIIDVCSTYAWVGFLKEIRDYNYQCLSEYLRQVWLLTKQNMRR